MKLSTLDISYCQQVVDLVQMLNPKIDRELLEKRFEEMLSYPTYICFGLLNSEDELIAVSSGWLTTRFYSGKQLELDAVVMQPAQRSKGYGKIFEELLVDWARKNDCLTMELNSYVANYRSHKFYLNQNYNILGYHFLKKLDGSEFSR